MHHLVAAALAERNYRRAARLIKQWQQTSPKDPLLLWAVGQLQEAKQQWDAAEKTYLRLLKRVNSPKLMGQARSALKRIQQVREASRQEALSEARAVLGSDAPGVLAIGSPDQPQRAAQGLAEVLRIDPYMARLQLPQRGLRLQRVGAIGEMQYYGEALEAIEIPAIWLTVENIKALQVFQVKHFRALSPQPMVVCQSPQGQLGSIQFDWSEVSQIVCGQLPIFEQVTEKGPWGKPKSKELVQDYAQVIDLQLHGRGIVLRSCDRSYEFAKSVPLVPNQTHLTSTRIRWNSLLQRISGSTATTTQNGFTSFGQGALEMISLLPYIPSYLDLDRQAPSDWDAAFQIYSSLVFYQGRKA